MSGCFLCGVESSLCTVCNCVQACEQHYSVHKPSGTSTYCEHCKTWFILKFLLSLLFLLIIL